MWWYFVEAGLSLFRLVAPPPEWFLSHLKGPRIDGSFRISTLYLLVTCSLLSRYFDVTYPLLDRY